MAQVINTYAGRDGTGQKILGEVFQFGDVIPGPLWGRVPPRNREAMLRMKRVEEDRVVVDAPKKRGRPAGSRNRKKAA